MKEWMKPIVVELDVCETKSGSGDSYEADVANGLGITNINWGHVKKYGVSKDMWDDWKNDGLSDDEIRRLILASCRSN